jgi:hypothetical protein
MAEKTPHWRTQRPRWAQLRSTDPYRVWRSLEFAKEMPERMGEPVTQTLQHVTDSSFVLLSLMKTTQKKLDDDAFQKHPDWPAYRRHVVMSNRTHNGRDLSVGVLASIHTFRDDAEAVAPFEDIVRERFAAMAEAVIDAAKGTALTIDLPPPAPQPE